MSITQFVGENKERLLSELFQLLCIPSVSAEPERKDDVRRCAGFIADAFMRAGADSARLIETDGHPLVLAKKKSSKSDAPTVLVYGHYDVQPTGDEALWVSPAFQPTMRQGKIYARGACDDKGQVFIHLVTLEYLSKTGELPCNLVYLIEGEEEVSSKNLESVLRTLKDELSLDCVLISDTDMLGKDRPSITVGLRGIAYFELRVEAAARELHSGMYGGSAENPFRVLTSVLAEMKDEAGKIKIPGFYDRVVLPRLEDKVAAEIVDAIQEKTKEELGIKSFIREEGFTSYESATCRPCMDIHGMPGGYTGEGGKTVIPAFASAKFSFRLVPDQDPEEIAGLLKDWLSERMPKNISWDLKNLGFGRASLLRTDSLEYKSAALAIEEVYGKTPLALRSGGSIPVTSLFERLFGIQAVLLGFGLEEDAIHSPNESFDLDQLWKGIETVSSFLRRYSEHGKFLRK